ncbi:FIG139991: Putative thiamine pyrophosphate-requiring enzyme [plant metagenome]|uniref:FIG139991: Putative thiamine pyrophosphate-requiring enzyme n=1 Tax=plant metagenome TaxID=1297885 RepID=A0A484XCU9_9ZZZZ
MSKTATLNPAPPTGSLWRRYRFYLSGLLFILPLIYLQPYFDQLALFRGAAGLGQRPAGEVQVGPWKMQMAEFEVGAPKSDPAGRVKTFTMALCQGCENEVRAVYLRVGKPRSLRAAGAIFFGGPHRAFATVPIPARTKPDDELWLTAEGWDGSMHQAPWPLSAASPTTVAWLNTQGAKQ